MTPQDYKDLAEAQLLYSKVWDYEMYRDLCGKDYRGAESELTVWLLEFRGGKVPWYVSTPRAEHITSDPWLAKRFETKEAAEQFVREHPMFWVWWGEDAPQAIQHVFVSEGQ